MCRSSAYTSSLNLLQWPPKMKIGGCLSYRGRQRGSELGSLIPGYMLRGWEVSGWTRIWSSEFASLVETNLTGLSMSVPVSLRAWGSFWITEDWNESSVWLGQVFAGLMKPCWGPGTKHSMGSIILSVCLYILWGWQVSYPTQDPGISSLLGRWRGRERGWEWWHPLC